MEKEWITALVGLGGVLVGGVIASFAKWLELRHLNKIQKNSARFARLEQLHLSIGTIVELTSTYYVACIELSDRSEISPYEKKFVDADNFAPVSQLHNSLLSQVRLNIPHLRDNDKITSQTDEIRKLGVQFLELEIDRKVFKNRVHESLGRWTELETLIEDEIDKIT